MEVETDWAELREKVYHYTRRFVHNSAIAEDVTSRAFCRYFKHPEYHNTKILYTIAKRLCFDKSKKQRRKLKRCPFDFLSLETASNDPASIAEQKELLVLLKRAFRELKPEYREPMEIYYFSGEIETIKDVATELKKTPATIKNRLARGREELKKLFKQLLADSDS